MSKTLTCGNLILLVNQPSVPNLSHYTASQEMGNPSKEVSDDDNSTSMGYFSEARQLAASQSFEAAIAKYTEAILANPTKAVFFANRAECFLRLKKPNAAIKDATRALEINPDQAKAYKVRGTARRYLGYYEDALHDLYASQKVDFDEDTDQIARSIKERVDTLVAVCTFNIRSFTFSETS